MAIDLTDPNVISVAIKFVQTTTPADNISSFGDLWFCTLNQTLYVYNGARTPKWDIVTAPFTYVAEWIAVQSGVGWGTGSGSNLRYYPENQCQITGLEVNGNQDYMGMRAAFGNYGWRLKGTATFFYTFNEYLKAYNTSTSPGTADVAQVFQFGLGWRCGFINSDTHTRIYNSINNAWTLGLNDCPYTPPATDGYPTLSANLPGMVMYHKCVYPLATYDTCIYDELTQVYTTATNSTFEYHPSYSGMTAYKNRSVVINMPSNSHQYWEEYNLLTQAWATDSHIFSITDTDCPWATSIAPYRLIYSGGYSKGNTNLHKAIIDFNRLVDTSTVTRAGWTNHIVTNTIYPSICYGTNGMFAMT